MRVTALDAHMRTEHTSLSYSCISIKPADKAVEYLISSYKPLLLLIVKKAKQKHSVGKSGGLGGTDWVRN